MSRNAQAEKSEVKAAAVPDLQFNIESAEAIRFAASPHIVFKLRVTANPAQSIHSVILKSQVQLDVARRRYSADEQSRLTDLFGEPARWGQTMRSTLWANVSTIVPSFNESTVIDLQVPCTFDFNAAATKYFSAIREGDIPVSLYFSGTLFYAGHDAALRAGQISWEKEAYCLLPAGVWREMMDRYYPNTAWLCLERDAFDRLCAYKVQHGLPTFDQALIHALEAAGRSAQ